MNKILRFDPSHLCFSEPLVIIPEMMKFLIECSTARNFNVFSIFSNKNKLICIMGTRTVHERVSEAFVIVSEFAKDHAIQIVKSVKELMDYHKHHLNVRRMQATVKISNETDKRFTELFGFKLEGVLSEYDPIDGTDHLMYGRIL